MKVEKAMFGKEGFRESHVDAVIFEITLGKHIWGKHLLKHWFNQINFDVATDLTF